MDLNILNSYYQDNLLIARKHPNLPLTIWNYSQKAQYNNKWDDITLNCRGLVTDDQGNIIARPFKKFFNLEENKHTATKDFKVYEKMDGCLIIVFYYQGQWICASRGSFNSSQAIKATQLLKNYNTSILNTINTYMFELIAPESKIVCQYDYEDLILLGARNTNTGVEFNVHTTKYKDLNLVKRYDSIHDYTHLKDNIDNNREGYVIRFSNGHRAKIKGKDYLRLHKAMSQLTTKAIWECLKNGDNIYQIIDTVPDEYFDKIKAYVTKLNVKYNLARKAIFDEYANIIMYTGDRKEFAQKAQKSKYAGILFNILDDRPYEDKIWELIKPKTEML